jgi:hypothetical protein
LTAVLAPSIFLLNTTTSPFHFRILSGKSDQKLPKNPPFSSPENTIKGQNPALSSLIFGVAMPLFSFY